MPEHFRRYLLINTGIILGSFVIFGSIFYFFSDSLAGEVQQIQADRAAIAQRSANLENLSDLKSHATTAADVQKKIDALLPTQDGLIAFPQFMNTTSRNHSLSLTFGFNGTPNPPSGGSPGFVQFTATVEGSTLNIQGFVDELEGKTTKFMINIDKVSLTPVADIFRADITGNVFFQDAKPTP